MSIWDWTSECKRQFREAGDEARLRMASFYRESIEISEQDPRRACALLLEGRKHAEQLGEPWWVFFYDIRYLRTVIEDLDDFSDILDKTIECTITAQKPEYMAHPWRIAAFNSLIEAYTRIDAIGYEQEVEQAFAHLDKTIPPGPGDDRNVMLGLRVDFLVQVNKLDEALHVGQQMWQLANEENDSVSTDEWYILNAIMDLCWVYFHQRDWDNIEHYKEYAEELATSISGRQRDLAEVYLYQAILLVVKGEREASRGRYHKAATRMRGLGQIPSEEYFQLATFYHTQTENLERALRTRERELLTIKNRGMFGYECRIHIERCKLLSRLGQLTQEAIDQATQATEKLRKPDSYLAAIEELKK